MSTSYQSVPLDYWNYNTGEEQQHLTTLPKEPHHEIQEIHMRKGKVVLKHGLGGLDWVSWASHSVTLTGLALIAWLNFSEFYWTDVNVWKTHWWLGNMSLENTLKALQFPVKAYELAVTTSVGMIALHFMRKRVTTKGLPLGLLVGFYEYSEWLYLLSKRWRSSLFHAKTFQDSAWAISIAITVIFCNTIGPLSAAVLVPTLQWWSIPNAYQYGNWTTKQSGDTFPIFSNYPPNEIWASSLTLDDPFYVANESCEDFATMITSNDCPSSGFTDLYNFATVNAGNNEEANLTRIDWKSQAQRILSSQASSKPGVYGTAIALTLTSTVTAAMDLFWNRLHRIPSYPLGIIDHIGRPLFSSPGNEAGRKTASVSNVYQPLVQVKCYGYDYESFSHENDNYYMYFQTDGLVNFTDSCAKPYENKTWFVPPDAWNFTHSLYNIGFTWTTPINTKTESNDFVKGISPSLGAVFMLPYAVSNDDGTFTQKSAFVPCLVDARWAAASVTYDPTFGQLVSSNLSNATTILSSPKNKCEPRSKWGIGDPIHIDESWANYLNPANVTFESAVFGSEQPSSIEFILQSYMSVFPPTALDDVDHIDTNGTVTFYNGTTDDLSEVTVIGFSGSPGPLYTNTTWWENTEQTLATLLSLIVADGIANAAVNSWLWEPNWADGHGNVYMEDLMGVNISASTTAADLESYWRLELSVQRYGYGYGVTTPLALCAVIVLSLYGLIVMSFHVYLVVSTICFNGWTSNEWDDLVAFFKLAVLSSKGHGSMLYEGLESDLDDERDLVNVRICEGDEENSMRLLLGGTDKANLPESMQLKIGKKYN